MEDLIKRFISGQKVEFNRVKIKDYMITQKVKTVV